MKQYNTNNFGSHFIGFDDFFDRLKEANGALGKITNYPPYNIKKVDDEHYTIEMAVAGFGKSNLDIEFKENELTITGKHESDESDYIYHGIANRAFTKKFTIADSVVVKDAALVNGILKVALERIVPDEKKPRKINIMDPFGIQETTKQFLNEGAIWGS